MKHTILCAMTLFGTIFGNGAMADQRYTTLPVRNPSEYVSELETFDIDHRLDYANQIDTGMVVLNDDKTELKLVLVRPFRCPPNLICAQVMPSPVIVSLPIVHAKKDSCGSTIYTAKRDARPVDGNLEMLRVIDNTARICLDLRPGIEVKHTIKTSGMGGSVETYVSYFTGSILEFKGNRYTMSETSAN